MRFIPCVMLCIACALLVIPCSIVPYFFGCVSSLYQCHSCIIAVSLLSVYLACYCIKHAFRSVFNASMCLFDSFNSQFHGVHRLLIACSMLNNVCFIWFIPCWISVSVRPVCCLTVVIGFIVCLFVAVWAGHCSHGVSLLCHCVSICRLMFFVGVSIRVIAFPFLSVCAQLLSFWYHSSLKVPKHFWNTYHTLVKAWYYYIFDRCLLSSTLCDESVRCVLRCPMCVCVSLLVQLCSKLVWRIWLLVIAYSMLLMNCFLRVMAGSSYALICECLTKLHQWRTLVIVVSIIWKADSSACIVRVIACAMISILWYCTSCIVECLSLSGRCSS